MNVEVEELPTAIATAVDVLWQHQPEPKQGHGSSWGCTSHTRAANCQATFRSYEAFLIHQAEVLANAGIGHTETTRRETLDEAAAVAETALTRALNLPAATAAEVAAQIRNAPVSAPGVGER